MTETPSSFPQAILSVSREEVDNVLLTIKAGLTETETSLPEDLQGYVFMVGPAGTVESPPSWDSPCVVLPTRDGFTPIYNGDGMVYRLGFENGRALLKTKIAESISYISDRITHENPNYPNLEFQNFGITRASLTLGVATQLSVTLTPYRLSDQDPYRLLLTVDMGRPFELDPATLEIIRPIGYNSQWKPVNPLFGKFIFKLAMSSAHPSFDFNTKELFTINLGKSISSFLPTIRQLFNIAPFLYDWLRHPQERRLMQKEQEGLFSGIFHLLAEIILWGQKCLRWVVTQIITILFWFLQLCDRIFECITNLFNDLCNNNFVELIRWNGETDPQGNATFDRWRVIIANGKNKGKNLKIVQTLHQMWATQNHIILLDTAFKISLEALLPHSRSYRIQEAEELFRDLTDVRQLADTPLYIINRAELVPGAETVEATALTIPREIAHYVVDYDDSEGIILHTVHSCATDAAENIRFFDETVYQDPEVNKRLKALSGMLVDGMDIDYIASYAIYPHTEKIKDCLINPDFAWGNPVYAYRNMTLKQPEHLDDMYWIFFGGWEELLSEYVANLYKDYKYRTCDYDEVLNINREGSATTLCHVHIERSRNESGELELTLTTPDFYAFPPGHFANSPQFVPRQNSTGQSDGYLVCVVLSDKPDGSDNTEIWLFDAADLANGPKYRLSNEKLNIGFTIHTTWLPEIVSPPPTPYNIQADYDPLVSKVVENYETSCLPLKRRIGKEIRHLFQEIYRYFS